MWRHLAQLKRRQAERDAFARQLIESQEGERKRLARELHDSLAQSLLIVKNWALVGLNSLAEDNPAREHLTEISETTSLALSEVREIAHTLRPPQLDRLGLTNTIEEMVRHVSNSSDIEFIAEIVNASPSSNACFTCRVRGNNNQSAPKPGFPSPPGGFNDHDESYSEIRFP